MSQGNSLSFLSKFDPSEFYELAKDMPNSIELDHQQLSTTVNLNNNESNLNDSNNNNIEIIGTHILLPESSLNQMIGMHLNGTSKLEDNIIVDFDTLSNQLSNEENIPSVSSDMPCQSFTGQFDFKLNISSPLNEKATKKSISYTYSKILNKLFCLPGVACPIEINLAYLPPAGSVIRAQAYYSKYEHIHERITRCENHKKNRDFENEASIELNEHIISHFIRSRHPRAYYEVNNQTLRESVVIPYERPLAGYNSTTFLYQFMCYSSCIGGIQKPAKIVVTLENNGEILGCDTFEIKICACPGRDLMTEEKKNVGEQTANVKTKEKAINIKEENHQEKSKVEIKNAEKPTQSRPKPQLSQIKIKSINRLDESDENENEKIFTLEVKGRKNYELLKFLKEAIEAKSMMPQLKRIDSGQKKDALNQNDKRPNTIIKQSSLKDTPKKIKTLEQFLEYYDMSAYYNLLVAKGINCLEDLLNATKQKINSLRISQKDTKKLLASIDQHSPIYNNANKSVTFLIDDGNQNDSLSNEPKPKRQKTNDDFDQIDLSDLKGLSTANISFNNNKSLYSLSSYTIKGSFNLSV